MWCLGVQIYNFWTILLSLLLAQFIRRFNYNCMCSGKSSKGSKASEVRQLPDFIIISISLFDFRTKKYWFTWILAVFNIQTPFSLFFLAFLLKCTQEYFIYKSVSSNIDISPFKSLRIKYIQKWQSIYLSFFNCFDIFRMNTRVT